MKPKALIVLALVAVFLLFESGAMEPGASKAGRAHSVLSGHPFRFYPDTF
jgi:hypothetical protein